MHRRRADTDGAQIRTARRQLLLVTVSLTFLTYMLALLRLNCPAQSIKAFGRYCVPFKVPDSGDEDVIWFRMHMPIAEVIINPMAVMQPIIYPGSATVQMTQSLTEVRGTHRPWTRHWSDSLSGCQWVG
jgi:hypothetical protein